jgi:limonene 1,2-monooxygenase
MAGIPLRHGAFLPPFHPMNENPAACIERDLELMQWLDRLGFHEAWIGEHHSAGWELISSPELFIAVAAERTRWIKFGTGVISLPYHNPLMTANRIIQLDHHTRGRIMFGAGPGLLASDALMLGIDPDMQRDRMAEALDVILRFSEAKPSPNGPNGTTSSVPAHISCLIPNPTRKSRWSAPSRRPAAVWPASTA